MSQQEMDQMDREVMALVNERQTEAVSEEGNVAQTTPQSAGSADSSPDKGSLERGAEGQSLHRAGAVPAPFVRCADISPADGGINPLHKGGMSGAEEKPEIATPEGRLDLDELVQEENGKYVITKEKYKQIKAEAEKTCRRRTVTCVIVCAAIAGALLVTFIRPGLLPWLVSLGVVSCSAIAGIAVGKQLG